MRTIRRMMLAAMVAGGALVACGGEGDIGEGCDTPGATDECVADAVCTNDSGGGATCREICVEQTDCPTGYNCNGVSGSSIKSCQPD